MNQVTATFGAWADSGGMIFLADVALKSIMVLSVAGIETIALRRAPAAWRHLVWTAAIASIRIFERRTSAPPTRSNPITTEDRRWLR